MTFWRRVPGNAASEQDERALAFGRVLDHARHGEAETVSLLYRQFLPGIFAYTAARIPDRTTAEDLTSEVFLHMIESIHHLRASDEAGFAAWLFQIARITVAAYYRRQGRQPVTLPLEPLSEEEENPALHAECPETHPDSDPVRKAEARDEWGAVARAINRLTEEQRQVVIARLILDYDVGTVAQMLGKKPNAIKALQFRALQSLHRYLAQEQMSNLSETRSAVQTATREERHASPF
ncbi:MAG: sigma-70 family RNA polymerase sigma factor [Ktedonobacteraceae bacterium]